MAKLQRVNLVLKNCANFHVLERASDAHSTRLRNAVADILELLKAENLSQQQFAPIIIAQIVAALNSTTRAM